MVKHNRSAWCVLFLLVAVLFLTYLYRLSHVEEGFTVEMVKSLSLLRGDPKKIKSEKDPFDRTYTRLYDTVFNVGPAYKYDIERIKTITKIDKSSRILDAGCGVGRHLKYLLELCPQAKVEAVDNSYQMTRRARIRNPGAEFITASLVGEGLYRPLSLTHILALHETLQMNSATNIGKILNNFHQWLQPSGWLVVHIVDPNKLDPAPREFSQYYKADNNVRHSLTYFEAFTHEAWWEKVSGSSNWYRYCEKFLFPEGQIKVATKKMWIPPVNEMLKLITNHGFRLREIVELSDIGITDFNLYIFRKEGK